MIHLLLLNFLFSNAWGADFRTRFSCATDHPTTSYALIEFRDSFELQIMHHNGTEFMPIHQGLITGYDLALLKEKADFFKLMGTRQVVTFKKEECTNKNEEWSCVKKEEVTLGQLKSKSLSFSITDKVTQTSKYTAEQKIAQISVVVGYHGYSSPMEYDKKNCVFYP